MYKRRGKFFFKIIIMLKLSKEYLRDNKDKDIPQDSMDYDYECVKISRPVRPN